MKINNNTAKTIFTAYQNGINLSAHYSAPVEYKTCPNCHEKFPIYYDKTQYTLGRFGTFCSWNCKCAYKRKKNIIGLYTPNGFRYLTSKEYYKLKDRHW